MCYFESVIAYYLYEKKLDEEQCQIKAHSCGEDFGVSCFAAYFKGIVLINHTG